MQAAMVARTCKSRTVRPHSQLDYQYGIDSQLDYQYGIDSQLDYQYGIDGTHQHGPEHRGRDGRIVPAKGMLS